MGTISLTVHQAKNYQLNEGDVVTVRAGTRTANGLVQIVAKRPKGSALSSELLKALSWPVDVPYRMRYCQSEGKLFIGPLLGILAYRPQNKTYSYSSELKETQRHAKRLGIVTVVFCPQDIHWEEGTIDGVIFGTRGWFRKTFPIPKAIYNRILSRKFENYPEIKECKKLLTGIPGLTLYNPRYLDKWETHVGLQQIPLTRALLPETRLLQHPDEIWSMVKQYRLIYLKPIHGSQGYGIYRLGIRPSGGFFFQSRNSASYFGKPLSKEAVEYKVKSLIDSTTYIAQQGLPLARIKGSPFDIRLVVQKDGKGVWRITKIFGRIAPPGKFTSNLSQGGTAMGIRNTLSAASVLRKRKRSVIIKELEKWGTVIPKLLEEKTGLNLGELGLDLALDQFGRLWLLEINSKPRKRLFTEEGDPEQVRLSLERPVAYGRFLDGF